MRLSSQVFGTLFLMTVACSGSSSSPALHSLVDGSWATVCIPRDDLFAAYRIVLDLKQAHDSLRTETYYADTTCSEALASLEYDGSYELMVTSRDYIYGIDFKFIDLALRSLNDEGRRRLEAAGFCGWSSGLRLRLRLL